MDPIEEIKSRIDIVDVISKHVELRRSGRNYKALCPFHTERTPSFVVFPDTQNWRCFGACAEGGDVYSFLMKRLGWDFGETLRDLARRTGVDLRPETPDQAKRREAHARLYELLASATLYYMHLLNSAPEAEPVRDYVVERGLLPHTVEQFQLGYSLDEWDAARTYLHGKGFTDKELLAAGLLVEKEETGRRYDRFRGRLMIPIRDLRGRVVGFGARTLQADEGAKYINSPQTALFDKSALLYGLDMAKKGIREAGQVIIVEGYMDVMQGHQNGWPSMVAQMGTALTEAQLRRLKRYTGRFVLALDADAAGQKATLRGLDTARQTLDREVQVLFEPRGLVRHESRLQADIRIATLPAGFDPDRLIREDQAAWAEIIVHARPLVEYLIDAIVAEADPGDAKSKSAAAARAMPVIRDVSDPIERDHYTQHLARRLGIDERTLAGMVARRTPPRKRRSRTPAQPPAPADEETGESGTQPAPLAVEVPSLPQELHCLKQLLVAPAAWQQTNTILLELGMYPISPQDFADTQNRTIFSALRERETADALAAELDQALRARLETIQAQQPPDPRLSAERVASHLAHTVLLMRKKANRRSKQDLDRAWADALSQHDSTAVGEYHQRVLELETVRLRIDRALGSIISPIAGAQEGT